MMRSVLEDKYLRPNTKYEETYGEWIRYRRKFERLRKINTRLKYLFDEHNTNKPPTIFKRNRINHNNNTNNIRNKNSSNN